jgi:hypothetical protein
VDSVDLRSERQPPWPHGRSCCCCCCCCCCIACRRTACEPKHADRMNAVIRATGRRLHECVEQERARLAGRPARNARVRCNVTDEHDRDGRDARRGVVPQVCQQERPPTCVTAWRRMQPTANCSSAAAASRARPYSVAASSALHTSDMNSLRCMPVYATTPSAAGAARR